MLICSQSMVGGGGVITNFFTRNRGGHNGGRKYFEGKIQVLRSVC